MECELIREKKQIIYRGSVSLNEKLEHAGVSLNENRGKCVMARNLRKDRYVEIWYG